MARPELSETPISDTRFLRACRGAAVDCTPVWVMRQAGRYLPEYRALKSKYDFLTMTRTADLAAQVTLQPLKRFDLDAAILFSDIMTPLEGLGIDIAFNPGPHVAHPFRSTSDLERLRTIEPENDVPFVLESISRVRAELANTVTLIGFAGAPFTLFCYLVAGGPSKEYGEARALLRADPDLGHSLLNRLGDAMGAYLRAQAEAGAGALMLFDSWVGLLARPEFDRFAVPAIRRALAPLRSLEVPIIYFANNGAALWESIAILGVDVVGVDWRSPLRAARLAFGWRDDAPGKPRPGRTVRPT